MWNLSLSAEMRLVLALQIPQLAIHNSVSNDLGHIAVPIQATEASLWCISWHIFFPLLWQIYECLWNTSVAFYYSLVVCLLEKLFDRRRCKPTSNESGHIGVIKKVMARCIGSTSDWLAVLLALPIPWHHHIQRYTHTKFGSWMKKFCTSGWYVEMLQLYFTTLIK